MTILGLDDQGHNTVETEEIIIIRYMYILGTN